MCHANGPTWPWTSSRYIKTHHNLEVHPSLTGLATAVCKKLSETGIFEDDAFFKWRDSTAGIVGHGATMVALKDFYEWLDSTPVESDYSQ